jgi:EAL domain-containing protein (putative c-di-GMP-specific phosphodiesterase class I)
MIKPIDLICVAQKIINASNGSVEYVELLCRLVGVPGADIEAYFDNLNTSKRLDIALWQIGLAQELYERAGLISSINIDHNLLSDKVSRFILLTQLMQTSVHSILEFTERHQLPDEEILNTFHQTLRTRGFRFALDDFGSRFSNEAKIFKYFDCVKISGELAARCVTEEPVRRMLIQTLAEISSAGCTHVVEGVETKAQFEALFRLGFRSFQGFLFHRPEPVKSVSNFPVQIP